MMMITFPHASNFQCSRGLFVAAWKVWFKRFHREPDSWREGRIPRHDNNINLSELIAQGKRFGVDVIARLMVPWPYRNTPQASEEFIRLNPALLRSCSYIDDATGSSYAGARLTDQALDYWDSLSFVAQEWYLVWAEARVQADIETPSSDPVIVDDAGSCVIGEDIYPPIVPTADADDSEFVKALVRWIDKDIYQPMYQRQPVGEPVAGWHDRLTRFFWPKPRVGYAAWGFLTDSLFYRARLLAQTVEKNQHWTVEEQFLAVKIANEIFNLFGVPQREVTPDNVRKVVAAALQGNGSTRAKMNSGWTWLAAFVTAHLETQADRLPLAGWNSRIAASLTQRLDFLLTEAGVSDLGGRFANLGGVPGWGGTRPRVVSLQWPDAYRKWSSQIAVSQLLRQMRDILNTETKSDGSLRYKAMPLPGGGIGPWTVMGINLVLFGDGY